MKDPWKRIFFDQFKSEFVTYRVPIIGGWLVRCSESYNDSDGNSMSESMVFVPDPNHKWKID